jgi:hypothetical protein
MQAQKSGAQAFRPAGDPALAGALDLYEWALAAVSMKTIQPWPEDAPRPVAKPDRESALHVASEIFLVAVAWILLHEIAHIELKHPFVPFLLERSRRSVTRIASPQTELSQASQNRSSS